MACQVAIVAPAANIVTATAENPQQAGSIVSNSQCVFRDPTPPRVWRRFD